MKQKKRKEKNRTEQKRMMGSCVLLGSKGFSLVKNHQILSQMFSYFYWEGGFFIKMYFVEPTHLGEKNQREEEREEASHPWLKLGKAEIVAGKFL